MLSNHYNRIDTLSFGLGNNANNVYQSVNNGCGLVMYRGSALGNWHSPFDCNPINTSNGTRLPLVLSFTCGTIGTGPTPAGAEMWFLVGSPTNLKGVSGYFATTTVGIGSITFLRSAVARGFFDAIFVDKKRTFGEACEGGRVRVYTMYPSGGDEEYVGFTTIGDPEMNLWTLRPCSLYVIHPQLIPVGSANFVVEVLSASNLSPIESAFVCIRAKQDANIYVLDTTDSQGNAYFSINPTIVEDTVYVTVTGRNLKPCEGYMVVRYTEFPYVYYLKSSVDDSLGGNNNHLINPQETINLPLWVRNWGDSTAYNIYGILRTQDYYTTILDSIKSFGNIWGQDSAFSGNDGYKFSVEYNCPDGHTINFDLVCRDIYDSMWVSHFYQMVSSANLVLQDVQISGGNGNSNIEVGETVFVKVLIKNSGSSALDSVAAILQSLSNYLGVIDSVGFYEHIGPDSTALNDFNPFLIYADSSTPQGTIANLALILSAPSYLDTLFFSLIIGKWDYYIWNPSSTPTPGQNMHNILSTLGYNGAIGTTFPENLQCYNVLFVCLGVYPNNYVISANSAEATGIVNFANNGGRIYMEGGDVWCYDPLIGGYDFSSLFGITPEGDGDSSMGPVAGIGGTFTSGMFFNYSGGNQFMDHIGPYASGSFLIFRDADDYLNCGVAYDAGNYRTVATSFELGMLVDGTPPSTRASLLDSIMHFFGISHGIAETVREPISVILNLKAFPNPFSEKTHISYFIGSNEPNTSLKIYDATGRLVKDLSRFLAGDLSSTQIIWDGRDDSGRKLSSGIYFVRLEKGSLNKTEKLILIR